VKILWITLLIGAACAGAGFAEPQDAYPDPVKETVILRLDRENRMNSDEIQKMFTALASSYLKSNTSYLLAYEVYRDRARQNLRPSLVLTELDYGSFTMVNLRYSFSNGYFEFKLSKTPFNNIINSEVVPSTDYGGNVSRDMYAQINNRLQEAVYISRGYAAMHRAASSASFYLFR
jgi:hypothetical protein